MLLKFTDPPTMTDSPRQNSGRWPLAMSPWVLPVVACLVAWGAVSVSYTHLTLPTKRIV